MKTSGSPLRIVTAALVALALIAAVSATSAYAGAKWINGKDIKKHSIPANRLKGVDANQIDGKIKGKKIANRSISRLQIQSDTITTEELSDGTIDQLQPSVEYVERRITTTGHPTVPGFALTPATCPAGEQAVAGYVRGGTAQWDPGYDHVDAATGAFMFRIYSHDGTEKYSDVQVMCLKPAPAAAATP